MNRTDLLIVDDDPDLSHAYGRTLTAAGFDVAYAASAQECLALVSARRPALVLLDVVLPDGNGLDLCRAIKTHPDYAGTFVVQVSGMRTQARDVSAGSRAGADEYLIKPVTQSALVNCVERLIRPPLPLESDATRVLVFEWRIGSSARTTKPGLEADAWLVASGISPRSADCAGSRTCRGAFYARRPARRRGYEPLETAPPARWYFCEHVDGRWSWHRIAVHLVRHSGARFATLGDAMHDAQRNGFVAERFREIVRRPRRRDGATH